MNKKIAFTFIAALGLTAAAPSYAQWYVGATGGQTDIKANNAQLADQFLDLGFDSANTSTNKRGSGYRVFGGYQIHRYLATELSYVDLGRYDSHTTVSPTGALDSRTKISGGEISLLGMLPITDGFSVFAKVGAFAAETKASYVGSGSVQTVNGGQSQKQKGTELSYGVGADYLIDKRFAVRGEWSRYTKLGNELTGGKTDVNLYSVGVLYRF